MAACAAARTCVRQSRSPSCGSRGSRAITRVALRRGTCGQVAHTMAHMGDVLAGIHSTWEFDTDSVLIRFERGIRTPKLFHVLGERRVPYEALSAVELAPGGKRGTVVLRAEPRVGADPLLDAAAGQLKEGCDPYRLVLPAERETLADYYATELRAVLGADADKPAEHHLVAAPAPPHSFKAYDGKASFDGKTVFFRWFWTGASSSEMEGGRPELPGDGARGRRVALARGHRRPSPSAAPRWQGAGDGGARQGPGLRGLRHRLRAGARVAPVRRLGARSRTRGGARGLPGSRGRDAAEPALRAPRTPAARTRPTSRSASGTWESCTRRGC